MRYIIYIIATGIMVILTFGLFGVWAWHALVPNLLLLAIISVSLAFSNYDYLIIAMLGGFWFDTLYGLPIGSFTIPFVIAGSMSSLIFQRWLFSEVTGKHFIITISIATLVLNFWLWAYTNILFFFKWSALAVSGTQLARNTILILIANVLLAYPVYVIVELLAQSTLRFKRNKIRL